MPLKPEHKEAVDKFISTDHRGKPHSAAHKAAMLHANPMVARILAARAMNLTDEERQALKSVLTPQTAPALKKLLPELAKIFDQEVKVNGG